MFLSDVAMGCCERRIVIVAAAVTSRLYELLVFHGMSTDLRGTPNNAKSRLNIAISYRSIEE